MTLKIIKGNLFTSNCQTLVNTVNCVGVMGAGIALEFRLRYPQMYTCYVELCKQNLMDIGKLWLYKTDQRWVINFPTKKHWKSPAEVEFLELGLQKFLDSYMEKKITSIAFPLLGNKNGGIPEELSLEVMNKYLEKCDLPIEIYIYDPNSPDDIFSKIKNILLSLQEREITELTGLKKQYINKLRKSFQDSSVQSLSKLLSIKGIGVTTIEKTLLLLK